MHHTSCFKSHLLVSLFSRLPVCFHFDHLPVLSLFLCHWKEPVIPFGRTTKQTSHSSSKPSLRRMDLFHKARLVRDFRPWRICQKNHTLSSSVEVPWLQEGAAFRAQCGKKRLLLPPASNFLYCLRSSRFFHAFISSSMPSLNPGLE